MRTTYPCCFALGNEKNVNKQEAKEELLRWYQKVEEENIESFLVAAQSIKAYEDTILIRLVLK